MELTGVKDLYFPYFNEDMFNAIALVAPMAIGNTTCKINDSFGNQVEIVLIANQPMALVLANLGLTAGGSIIIESQSVRMIFTV